MKNGFTLAEVLITLGIIGIISVLTIPNLIMNKSKKEIQTQMEKEYSSIQQAAFMAEKDGFFLYNVKNDAKALSEWFDAYLGKYLKISKKCINKAGCWHKANTIKLLNNAALDYNTTDKGWGARVLTLVMSNGAYYNIDVWANDSRFGVDRNEQLLVITIDINGDKEPNVFGKDIYVVAWTKDGIVPAGYAKTKKQVENNCLKGNGYWCLQYLIQNEWKIDDRVWKR